MNKVHVAIVSLLLAVAAVLGTLAVTRTAMVRTQRNDAAYQARVAQLNAAEAKLRRALAQPGPSPRVVYHRPPPVVVTVHRSHGDDGYEGSGGSDD